MRTRHVVIVVLLVAAGLLVWFLMGESGEPESQERPSSASVGSGVPIVLRGSPGMAAPVPAPQPVADDGSPLELQGHVLSRRTGLPVEGASVCLAGSASERCVDLSNAVRSGPDGGFKFRAPPSSATRLVVVAPDHLPWSSDIRTESLTGMIIHLEAGAEISGRITDMTGAPVVRARIWCHQPGVGFGWPHVDSSIALGPVSAGATTFSDGQGHFRLRGLGHDTTYRLRVTKPGWTVLPEKRSFQFAYTPPRLVSAGDMDVVVRMSATFMLTVLPKDATSGRPLSGRVFPDGVAQAGLAMVGDRSPYDELLDAKSRVPEGHGRHVYCFLASGKARKARGEATVRIVVDALGYRRKAVDVPVRLGSATDLPIDMEREVASWKTFRVVARLPDGQGYSGRLGLRIGREGRIQIHSLDFASGLGPSLGLPPGSYQAVPLGSGSAGQWWGQAGPAVEFDVPSGGGAPSLVLALSGSRVAVHAIAPGGEAVRGYGLSVKRAGSSTGWPVADWDAPGLRGDAPDFDEDPHLWLSPGTFTLRVFGPGHQPASQVVEVPGRGDSIRAEFVLYPR